MKRAHNLPLAQVNNYLAGYIEFLNVKIKNNNMKKITFFVLLSLLGGLQAFAADATISDTTFTYHDKLFNIEDSTGQVKIKVYDSTSSNDSVPLKQIFEGIYTDEKSYEKWTVMEELGFQIPFIGKKKHNHDMEAHWAGIGFGLTNVTDGFLNLSSIDGFALNSIKSQEFFFNFTEKIIPIFRNNLGITTGMGFDWRNYHFDNNVHLTKTAGIVSTTPAPEGITYKYSRLRTVYFTIPLMLEWQPTFGNNHSTFLAAGAVGGIRTLASSKIKYEDAEGSNIKKVEGRGMNVAPLSLDYIAMAGMDDFSIYAKYSPFSIFQIDKGPDVKAVSIGVVLGF